MDDYKSKYNEWLNNPDFDDETKKELKSIEGNEEEIKDRFYKELDPVIILCLIFLLHQMYILTYYLIYSL